MLMRGIETQDLMVMVPIDGLLALMALGVTGDWVVKTFLGAWWK